ncbi:MAG: hypothetical protein WBF50_00555 [Pseudolabrys sp.]
MRTAIENNVSPPEFYVVEIDGEPRSVYGVFIEALKAGMELKQKFPHRQIKLQDARGVSLG